MPLPFLSSIVSKFAIPEKEETDPYTRGFKTKKGRDIRELAENIIGRGKDSEDPIQTAAWTIDMARKDPNNSPLKDLDLDPEEAADLDRFIWSGTLSHGAGGVGRGLSEVAHQGYEGFLKPLLAKLPNQEMLPKGIQNIQGQSSVPGGDAADRRIKVAREGAKYFTEGQGKELPGGFISRLLKQSYLNDLF